MWEPKDGQNHGRCDEFSDGDGKPWVAARLITGSEPSAQSEAEEESADDF